MSEQSAKPYLIRAICEWCARQRAHALSRGQGQRADARAGGVRQERRDRAQRQRDRDAQAHDRQRLGAVLRALQRRLAGGRGADERGVGDLRQGDGLRLRLQCRRRIRWPRCPRPPRRASPTSRSRPRTARTREGQAQAAPARICRSSNNAPQVPCGSGFSLIFGPFAFPRMSRESGTPCRTSMKRQTDRPVKYGPRRHSSGVEQRFCKPLVVGSIPTAGTSHELAASQCSLLGAACRYRCADLAFPSA